MQIVIGLLTGLDKSQDHARCMAKTNDRLWQDFVTGHSKFDAALATDLNRVRLEVQALINHSTLR